MLVGFSSDLKRSWTSASRAPMVPIIFLFASDLAMTARPETASRLTFGTGGRGWGNGGGASASDDTPIDRRIRPRETGRVAARGEGVGSETHRDVGAPLRHVDQGEQELGVHGGAHAELGRGGGHHGDGCPAREKCARRIRNEKWVCYSKENTSIS